MNGNCANENGPHRNALATASHLCLRPRFIEAVRALPQLGLSFDITVNHRHMSRLPRFVELAGGEVALMLDHCGKPAFRDGLIEPWRTHLRALAEHPNVYCKLFYRANAWTFYRIGAREQTRER